MARPSLPSRPRGFHPEPLTDPDLTLSRHPARAIARRLPPSAETSGSSGLTQFAQLNGDDPPHWDRSRARLAVGGGVPFLLFRLQVGFTVPPWLTFPEAPPIIPDGQISRVRFETSAFLPRAFP